MSARERMRLRAPHLANEFAISKISGNFVRKTVLNRYRTLATLLAAGTMLSTSGTAVFSASDGPPVSASGGESSNEALLREIRAMKERIRVLEGRAKKENARATVASLPRPSGPPAPSPERAAPLATRVTRGTAWSAAQSPTPMAPPDNGILGLAPSPIPGLSVGAYGEVKFGRQQNPDAGGQWQNGFDAHRFVLLPTYAITPNIIFNAEIEFEHAGIAFDNDDKLHGTAEIEQLWVDFKIVDQFNVRSPGIDLIPIGYINQHHEPTQFYSVNRPELYNGLIPSTWKAPATSIYGTVADGLRYQIMLSASNEDYGDSFDNRLDSKRVTRDSYEAGINGLEALALSRPVLGDFQQLNNAVAVSGKVDYAPEFLPGFAGSVSGYYTPNTTPRGAHDDFGNTLGRSSLAMFDAEARYRVFGTGLELRGEYVEAFFGKPGNLRANNDSDPTNNVGKTMFGASGEIAYHFPLGTILNSDWEAVPFYRYTYQNFQTSGFAGTDLNLPTGAGQTQFHTAGIAVFPSPQIVLKATYQKVINRDRSGANADSVLGGVGFFF